MLREMFSYYPISKKCSSILILLLFICSPSLESFDGLAKIGYFAPVHKHFREIYTKYGLALGIEVAFPIYPWNLPFEAFIEIDDTHASGKIDTTPGNRATAVKTSFRLLQLDVGLKYYFQFPWLSFYVAAAPTINYIHTKTEWQLPARSINLRNIGYLTRVGTAFFVRDLLIDVSVDYLSVPVGLNSTQKQRFSFLSEVGGFRLYCCFGFRY